MFRKVLIANRGEIAVRLIRALREMGIQSVAVYSDADRRSLHVRMADEAVHIGPAPSTESYLRIDRILGAARARGAEAIHPGYGFLSENADFAAACRDAGIVFIGPSPDSIRLMGSKTAARATAVEAGVPVVPGSTEAVQDLDEARRVSRELGYPLMLKAVAGGGGKGMRRIENESELESAFRNASSEAERAFKDARLYLEKLISNPRHIEIQLIGDHSGNIIHLGERECSIQRRHQKVIEECPSPLVALHPEIRQAMGEAAVRVARAAGYHNAGTIEFLADSDGHFYFLEMNTRLQVEHPVTELVTGLDLVKLQIQVAAGRRLCLRQDQISWRGAAIECRIYAEDPDNHFFPSPGRITRVDRPAGPGIRLDECVYSGWSVPVHYDPLLAKLVAWADTRSDAIARMRRALGEYVIGGIRTNISFFDEILQDEEFQQGRLHTGFLDEFFNRRAPRPDRPDLEKVAALVAAVHNLREPEPIPPRSSRWLHSGRDQLLR